MTSAPLHFISKDCLDVSSYPLALSSAKIEGDTRLLTMRARPKILLAHSYEQAMGLRTLPGYVDSQSVSSKPKVFAVSLRKCDSSRKMYGPSLTISECPKIQYCGHDAK